MVVEASRPRARAVLGLVADDLLADPAGPAVWVSITATAAKPARGVRRRRRGGGRLAGPRPGRPAVPVMRWPIRSAAWPRRPRRWSSWPPATAAWSRRPWPAWPRPTPIPDRTRTRTRTRDSRPAPTVHGDRRPGRTDHHRRAGGGRRDHRRRADLLTWGGRGCCPRRARRCPGCTTTTSTCWPWPPPAGRSTPPAAPTPQRSTPRWATPRTAGSIGGWLRVVGADDRHGPLDAAWLERRRWAGRVRVQHRSGAAWMLSPGGPGRHRFHDEPDGWIHRRDARAARPDLEGPPDLGAVGTRLERARHHRRHRRHAVRRCHWPRARWPPRGATGRSRSRRPPPAVRRWRARSRPPAGSVGR